MAAGRGDNSLPHSPDGCGDRRESLGFRGNRSKGNVVLPQKPEIIVVNSLVARGAVGARASVFALERLGFTVWTVPTVLLPWHPGQGAGTRITPDQSAFSSIIDDLAGAPALAGVGAVLTGYFGAPEQVAAAVRLIRAVKAANPQARVLCDPVLGDNGRLYQPEATLTAVRDLLLPLADVATPNRSELGFLTGHDLPDDDALVRAAKTLGRAEVVVTSAFAPAGLMANLLVTRTEALIAEHPSHDGAPNGTGDLFAALYLGHRLSGAMPGDALVRATASTARLVEQAAGEGMDELPLAGSQDVLFANSSGIAVRRL